MRCALLALLVLSVVLSVACDETPSNNSALANDGGLVPDFNGAPVNTAANATGQDAISSSDGISPQPGQGDFPSEQDSRFWVHAAKTSALIYWLVGRIDRSATSTVEFGTTSAYGNKTPETTEPRLAQLHRLTGLKPSTTYHFRMVMTLDDGSQATSADQTFTTNKIANAVAVPGKLSGPPYKLDQDGATYILTDDINAGDTAIEITGSDVTLELDGHQVTFGTESSGQVFGIRVKGSGKAVVQNGHVVQGDAAGNYSSCVETRWRESPIEVFGITTEVHRPNGYPLRLFGSGQRAEIHHNHLHSTVTEIESRHYPGNDLLHIDASGPDISVHDNLLTEGAHRGISISGDGNNIEVAYNDVRHHALYVNGYALGCSVAGMNVHHNRVTSVGRGAHLTDPEIHFHHNHLDIKGHMTLSDLPAKTYPFKERRIELHGIKLEGSNAIDARIHDNYMRIIQPVPDEQWDYVPATPLNIASYNSNANNEIFDNTFIALTEHAETRHGGYGDSGQWASTIYLVSMDKGSADHGKHSVYIHDNEFLSNDLFVSASKNVNMTVRVEDNTFTLATTPPPTETHAPFRNLGALGEAIKSGNNTFVGMQP